MRPHLFSELISYLHSRVDQIISFTLNLLSILSLAVTLFTYILFKVMIRLMVIRNNCAWIHKSKVQPQNYVFLRI